MSRLGRKERTNLVTTRACWSSSFRRVGHREVGVRVCPALQLYRRRPKIWIIDAAGSSKAHDLLRHHDPNARSSSPSPSFNKRHSRPRIRWSSLRARIPICSSGRRRRYRVHVRLFHKIQLYSILLTRVETLTLAHA